MNIDYWLAESISIVLDNSSFTKFNYTVVGEIDLWDGEY